jgi:hypothetical protein
MVKSVNYCTSAQPLVYSRGKDHGLFCTSTLMNSLSYLQCSYMMDSTMWPFRRCLGEYKK